MLHLPRRVWIQLTILALVTVLACGTMAFAFMALPATLFGIGQYRVTLELPSSGGLYETSNVTYRGTDVGQVTSVDVTRDGVTAVLTLESAIPIPSDVEASVHSRSAIGEQFVELTPAPGTSSETPSLTNGDVIPTGRVQVPVDIAGLLDATNRALQAIPQDNLRTVVDEGAVAVGGLGPELARIVDGSTTLAADAAATTEPLTRLIDESGPVFNSQVQTADSIAAWAQRTASITGQLKAQDTALTQLLTQGGPGFTEGTQLFDRVAPALPVVLANLVSLGDIAVTYRADLEQLLVLLPQGTAAMSAIVTPNRNERTDYRGAYLDFNLNLNLPPPCTTGYLPPEQRRSPSDVDAPDRPAADIYCRVPQDSMFNVRGVRNTPCETVPGKRAPTVAMCESTDTYVPLNQGTAWRGDPNATTSGQGVPQPDPAPAPPAPPPAPVAPPAVATYDPATGDYIGPDGRRYTQGDLAHPGHKTWQSMLVPPVG